MTPGKQGGSEVEARFDARSALIAARRRGRRATLIAVILGCFLIFAASAFFLYERSVIEHSAETTSALYAKVLEDQTTRVVSNVEVISLSLTESIGRLPESAPAEVLDNLLATGAEGQAFLRSVALVSADGRILASSFEGDRGGSVKWSDLGGLQPQINALRLSALRAGRSLSALGEVRLRANAPLALPLIRPVRRGDGEYAYLVCLINLDYLANQFERLLDDPKILAALASYDGELLIASRSLNMEPGVNLSGLPVFSELLPKRDHATYKARGMSSATVVGAYRASRNLPLVVLVEEPRSVLVAQLRREFLWIGGGTLALCLLLAGSTYLVRNSSKRDEKLTLRLQSAYANALELESRKESILKASLDAVISTDGQGRVLDYNPAAERMFGYQLASARNVPLDQLLLHPDVRGKLRHDLPHFLREGSEVLNRVMQIEATRKDGSRVPIEFTIVPVLSGGESFYTVTIRDISERYRAEQELRESEQRWKLALEAAGDGVWDWDIANDVTVYSSHWLAMLGFSHGELEPTHLAWRNLLHPDDSDYVASELQEHLDGHLATFSSECRMRCKNGSWKWILARGMVVERSRDGKTPLRLVGTHTDISERKATEVERADLLIKSHELAEELRRARETELNVGSKIQNSLLLTPQTTRMSDLWVSCFNQASQGVDGDFVEVISPGEHAVDIIVGDVMGKGVNAALMGAAVKMQLSRSLIELMTGNARFGELPSPAAIVQSVHHAVTPHLQALDAFVTLCYLRIDTRANTVTWVGCGHEETLLIREGQKPRLLNNQQPPLGVLDDMKFVQESARMTARDALFLHSDGITDAVLANGERLGHDRLQKVLTELLSTHKTPAAVIHQMRRQLFQDGVRFTDDLTMVLASRHMAGFPTQRLELECRLDSILELRRLVSSEGQAHGMDESQASLLAVASVEAFTNIVRHAKGRLTGAPVEVVASRVPGALQIEMVYLGEAFNPEPGFSSPDLRSFPEGGFGLSIIRDVCDEASFVHRSGVNTVCLRKSVKPAIREMLLT